MKRTFFYLLLCAVCLGVNAKKVKKQTQPLWPDGTPIAEWFNDTTKVDVNTLGKKYVITEYGVKNDSSIVQTDAIQKVIDLAASNGGGVIVIPRSSARWSACPAPPIAMSALWPRFAALMPKDWKTNCPSRP